MLWEKIQNTFFFQWLGNGICMCFEMVRIHWENMPPYQIVLALLQDSVLPLGRSSAVRCWRQVELFCVILLIFWNSQKVHWITIFILCANVHTKMIMILHGKNEANFFKTRRWVSKNFFFLMFKAVAYVVLRFYPIFYLPLMSWNEGIFWACHQIFSSQKRLKPLSLALFSFVVHSEFFFTWICHKKASYLIEVEMSTTSIVAAATKEGLLSLWRLIKTPLSKRTNFSWNPRVHALFKE